MKFSIRQRCVCGAEIEAFSEGGSYEPTSIIATWVEQHLCTARLPVFRKIQEEG